MKEELTLLSLEDVFGVIATLGSNQLSGCLDVIEKHGRTAEATDLAILTGAFVNSINKNESEYFLKNFWSDDMVTCVDFNGDMTPTDCTRRSAIRPVLIPANFSDIVSANDDIVEYGEYPQTVASSKLQKELNNEFANSNLSGTHRLYTFDGTACDEKELFEPLVYHEFEYKNNRYIRVKANASFNNFWLSNGEEYYDGDYVWIQVEPVKWLVDYTAKKLVSLKVLLGGIRFCDKKTNEHNFDKSEIKRYLNKYMLPEITHQKKNDQLKQNDNEVKKVINPYGLSFDKVSEEDIIKGSIESDVPVFLHGQSSEGKSARVKQIDPNCEIIYLRNATPESLNGKSVYNAETGEMIDIKPTWLKKLEEKCKALPDKLHVLFFDELTNALPSIQGMAFNIVLDREVNGIWKLPENARIVAAGNEMDDSLAANELAEPLYNRFMHVYIKTTVDNWLVWASLNNIHPAIYAYIAYKGEGALRSKYDGKKPNADPRKWEMASKILYQTGNPEMIRGLVGDDITREFVKFCKTEVITIDDVINHNYKIEYLVHLDISERYATTMYLSQVGEEHLEKVRNFVSIFGGEYRAFFDLLWTHGDLERLEKIAEMNLNSEEKEEVISVDDIDDNVSENEIIDINDVMKKVKTIENVFNQFSQYF